MKIDKIVKLLKVSKSKQCVIVCFSHFQKSSKKTELICGEVSASFDDENWYINRAIVKPESLRGHGIGSLMLTKLKDALIEQGCKKLIVYPGGYAGEKRKQIKFYKKNGFVKEDNCFCTSLFRKI
jgi:ribosomal protein S18 acetylase RimI-like enzyme